MTDVAITPCVVPILPCIDLNESTAFYGRLGFKLVSDHGDYRLLEASGGLRLHLRAAEPDWVDSRRNANGIYIYADNIDALAAEMSGSIIGSDAPQLMPWGMYEFAVSDPNGTLVRIGRPSENGRP